MTYNRFLFLGRISSPIRKKSCLLLRTDLLNTYIQCSNIPSVVFYDAIQDCYIPSFNQTKINEQSEGAKSVLNIEKQYQ